jgi:hypothetical protein
MVVNRNEPDLVFSSFTKAFPKFVLGNLLYIPDIGILYVDTTTAHNIISVFSSGARCKHGGFLAEST